MEVRMEKEISIEEFSDRNPYYDNVKGILIILVVFCHVIQKYIHNGFSYLYIPFFIIYTFHMPLFVFLSGYFSKDAKKAQAKAFERFLLPYIVWSFVYFIVISLTHWKSDFNFAIPWFTYWYFVSLFTLCLFLPVMLKIRLNVFIFFVLMFAAGFYQDYGWAFSLSRTICFAPFFLMGYYCKSSALDKIRRYRIFVLIVTIAVFMALLVLCLSDAVRFFTRIIERSMWMAEPYQASRALGYLGPIYRGIIIIGALVFGSCIFAFAPKKKTLLSKIGKNTVVIFVFHGYFVQYMNDFFTFDPATVSGVLLMILISLGITAFLSLNWWNRTYLWLMKQLQNLIIKEKQ